MLIHSNVDRTASAAVSKAPFTFDSTLELAGARIPEDAILSIKVYVEENALAPFRIHSITTDGRVVFCDANGIPVLFWQTYEETDALESGLVSSLLYNYNGVIAGHIVCKDTVIYLIRSLVASTTTSIPVSANAFVLIPQCHVAMLSGCCRSICINSLGNEEYHTGNITLTVAATQEDEPSVLMQTDTQDCILSISDSFESVCKQYHSNGICGVEVSGTTY